MSRIIFDSKEHFYYLEGKKRTKPKSVTGIVEQYSSDFDENYWSEYKAWQKVLCSGNKKQVSKQFYNIRKDIGILELQNPELFIRLRALHGEIDIDKEIQIILKEWKEKNINSQIKGTEYHDAMEKRSINRGYELNPWDNRKYNVIIGWEYEKGLKKSTVDLLNLKKGYYPELIIHYDGIFGQIDRLWVDDDRNFWIRDYKSNEEIKQENKYQHMNYPLQNYDDCNYNHYRCQLSIYAWMMIQMGYTLKGLAIDHFNKEYQFDILEEVDLLILDYNLNNV